MEQTFTKSLADVWNLISIPVTLTNKTVQSTLSSIDGKYSIVWGYNASDTADPWKSYVPGYGSDVNDLSDIGVQWGYWVRVNSTPATLNVSGNEPTSTNIPLVNVWNLVGYPKLTAAANVSTALASIDGNYTIVWGYNASDTADPWKSYVPGYGSDVNDLSQLTPGSGYWIRVNTTSETLTI
jgi:hypothetical protein